MDLNRVAVAVEVVERGSFTAAAATLGLPKSSVSRSVAQLEHDLGVTLLRRTTRKLALTDAGKQWYERARHALCELEEASALVSRGEREPTGLVRLTAPPDMGPVLAPVLVSFAERYPHVHVELLLTSRRLDLIDDGVDLALRAGQLEDSSLVARKLLSTDMALYSTPAYLERRGRPRKPSDLAKHDCVLFRAVHGRATWELESASTSARVDVTGLLSADDMAFVLDAVLAGGGIGLLPEIRCRPLVEDQRLERVLPAWSFAGAAFYLVHAGSRYMPHRVELLRDFLTERLAKCVEVNANGRRARAR